MSDLFFDNVTLSSDPRIGEDGVFRTTGRFSRVGVQTYFDAQGNRIRRFRPPAEVRKAADTFNMAVVTKDHPVNDAGQLVPVTAENREQFQVGFSSTPQFRDGWLEGEIAITDKSAIRAAQTTHKYFSDGYSATIVPSVGVFVDADGFVGNAGLAYEYDEMMVDITGNHRAIVSNPRAGRMAVMDGLNVVDVGPGTGVACGGSHISSDKTCRIEGGGGGGSGSAPSFGGKTPSFRDFTNQWTEYIEGADELVPEGASDDEFDRIFEQEVAKRQEELVATVPETFGGEKEEVRELDYDEAVAAAYVHIYPEAADEFFALGEEEQHRLLSGDSMEDTMPEKTYTITIGDQSQEVPKEFYDAWKKENQRKLVVDSQDTLQGGTATFTADQMAAEFTKRQQAFTDAKPFLPENVQFDGGKTAEQWLSDALSNQGVDVTQIADVASAFVGLQLAQRKGPTPVQRFAWQVADAQEQQSQVVDSEDVDNLLRKQLMDAQQRNATARHNAINRTLGRA